MERKNKVLIVDDEPGARDALGAFLFREKYEIAFAASGQEALGKLDQFEPDVILLDVMMPDMDGFEVCHIIRENERWRHIPVILVTALDHKENMIQGLEAGANEFLTKPVNSVELRARMRAMLRMKKQYDELQEAMQLREDLANMIVHDMKNPLTTILLVTGLLHEKQDITIDEMHEYIQEIEIQARRVTSYFDDMLIMTKMEAGRFHLDRTMIDVHQMVLMTERNHRVLAQSRGINLVVDSPKEKRLIALDVPLFQRVLDNLISNALKFSPPHSTVTLCAEYLQEANTNGHSVRIKIIDEGSGVPKEYRERIFDKFEVVTMKRREGVRQFGLGLPFCKMVTEAHGGRIFLEDNEPAGAIFTVEV